METSGRAVIPGEAWFAAGSFALSTALALRLAAAQGALWLALAAALAVAAFALFRLMCSRRRAGRRSGPLVALAALNLVLLVPELGLRSAGFRHVSGVQFGYPSPTDFLELEPDEHLFWRLPSSAPGANSLGFAGPEPRVPKPAGERRILFLGDSCLYQGHPRAWPELATRMLASDAGGPIAAVNLSLAGYSTHQGRILAEQQGERLEPDLVVVSYGWNDHWLARGATDADKRIEAHYERVYRHSRLLQLARKLASGGEAAVLDVARVPKEAYAANLAAIVRGFRTRGVPVMLVTAPTVHDLAVPEYLLKHSFARSAEDVVRVHAEYVELTRAVARDEGAALLDLEALVAARPERVDWFLGDGIHYTDSGRAALASLFVEQVREQGILR